MMSGFFMWGLRRRMNQKKDPVVASRLERAVLHFVPNINPDGSGGAFNRLNGGNADLNCNWTVPSQGEP